MPLGSSVKSFRSARRRSTVGLSTDGPVKRLCGPTGEAATTQRSPLCSPSPYVEQLPCLGGQPRCPWVSRGRGMSITVKLDVAHENLALVPTLTRLDDIGIQVIAQQNTDPGAIVFPFLIEYHDRSALESTLEADPTVASFECVDWTDGSGIFYIEHSAEAKLLSPVVTAVNGFTLQTRTKGPGWVIQVQLPDREALNTIWQFARSNDISLDILEIYGQSGALGDASYGLTDEQKEAVIAAYEGGYFNEPRDNSLSDLAEELDLSSTAMSGRLRRGVRNLVAATVGDDSSSDS